MVTKILSKENQSEEEIFREVKNILENGGLVAFPTETVYGLGGNALLPEASRKIYEAKGRPSDNPLIVHIGNLSQVKILASEIPTAAEKLMEEFWPGPLTLIFKKNPIIPDETTGGLDTVGIRFPSHSFTKRMLENIKIPVAAPSANLSGRPSTTKASHVIEDLSGKIDAIISEEDSEIGIESTIVDVTGEYPMILRPGFITKDALEEVVGKVLIDPAITTENLISKKITVSKPKAPGMKYRHYAPKGELTVLYGEESDVIRKLQALQGSGVGILTVDEHRQYFEDGTVISLGSRKHPEEIAHNLFSSLRLMDDYGIMKIYSEDFSIGNLGNAIMNRLLKAAGGEYKKAEGGDDCNRK